MKNIFKKGLALFLAGATDGSFGLLIVFLFSKILNYPTSFGIYFLGLILALTPDILDALIQLTVEKKIDSNHRKFTHYPLFVIPIFFILHCFSVFWAWVICSCFLVHFIHDSGGNEENRWGIKWLFPFSNNYYQFFGKKRKKRAFSIIIEWTPREIKNRKIDDLDSWLEKNYMKFPLESFTGLMLGIATLTIIFW
ncbi:MAG: metal-dependent hydrolase [Candidatus Marinimicrobia bacterium]|nr:metal-dependent hydrolase [Candidatus Neomarinimicrobiota bacterium]